MDIQSLRYMLNWTPILMFTRILPDGTKPLPPYSMTQSAFRDLLSDFSRRGYTSGPWRMWRACWGAVAPGKNVWC